MDDTKASLLMTRPGGKIFPGLKAKFREQTPQTLALYRELGPGRVPDPGAGTVPGRGPDPGAGPGPGPPLVTQRYFENIVYCYFLASLAR